MKKFLFSIIGVALAILTFVGCTCNGVKVPPTSSSSDNSSYDTAVDASTEISSEDVNSDESMDESLEGSENSSETVSDENSEEFSSEGESFGSENSEEFSSEGESFGSENSEEVSSEEVSSEDSSSEQVYISASYDEVSYEDEPGENSAGSTTQTYTLTYNLGVLENNASANLNGSRIKTIRYGEIFTLPTPTCAGWDFLYWTVEGETTEFTASTYPFKKNVTLVAVWVENEHTGWH